MATKLVRFQQKDNPRQGIFIGTRFGTQYLDHGESAAAIYRRLRTDWNELPVPQTDVFRTGKAAFCAFTPRGLERFEGLIRQLVAIHPADIEVVDIDPDVVDIHYEDEYQAVFSGGSHG